MTDTKRRDFLKVAAAATAASACGTGAQMMMTPDPDIMNLNALLAAEYKAIDAYAQGATVLMADTSALGQLVLKVALKFQQDHKDHAAVLAKAVTSLSGTPVTADANTYTLPTGFKGTTVNVMKLACNEERKAAVAYNQVLKGLKAKDNRFVAAAIQGDETMHYVVLAALIEGLVVPTASLTPTMNVEQVVPVAFASATTAMGGGAGLQSQTDFATDDMG